MDRETKLRLKSCYYNTIEPSERVGEWATAKGFMDWAMENGGYQYGTRIFRRKLSRPRSPDNCYFAMVSDRERETRSPKEVIYSWNKTVNVFRRIAGLEPFPESEDVSNERTISAEAAKAEGEEENETLCSG